MTKALKDMSGTNWIDFVFQEDEWFHFLAQKFQNNPQWKTIFVPRPGTKRKILTEEATPIIQKRMKDTLTTMVHDQHYVASSIKNCKEN